MFYTFYSVKAQPDIRFIVQTSMKTRFADKGQRRPSFRSVLTESSTGVRDYVGCGFFVVSRNNRNHKFGIMQDKVKEKLIRSSMPCIVGILYH